MQAQRQADINEKVAVALERLNGRMEAVEHELKEQADERARWEDRRFRREDKQPELQRSDFAIVISACMFLLFVGQLISQHWH